MIALLGSPELGCEPLTIGDVIRQKVDANEFSLGIKRCEQA